MKCWSFIVIFLSALVITSPAEDTRKIDSLKLLLQNSKSDSSRIDILLQLGNAYTAIDTAMAIDYVKKIFEISERTKSTYKTEVAYHVIGFLYYRNYKYRTAIEYIDRGISVSRIKKDTARLGILHYLKGASFMDFAEYDSSCNNYNKGINFYTGIKRFGQVAEGYRLLGCVKWLMGDYTLATEYLEKSLPLFDQAGNEIGKAAALNNIAILCFEQELYSQALEYYDAALEIFNKSGDEESIGMVYLNQGEIYWKRKEYNKALDFYNRSLALSIKVNSITNYAYGYNNIGIVYFETKDYTKSSENYQKALEIWERMGDKTGLIYCLNYIAILKYELGFYDQAVSNALRALKIAKQIGSKDEIRRAHETLSKAYYKIGAYKKAYESHVLYKEINDSIFNGKSKNRLLSIESRNQLEKQKHQIEIQKIDLELKDTRIKNQATIRNAMIGGLILLVVVIFLVAYAYLMKKRKNVEITNQKIEIEKHKDQIEKIHEELTSSIRYARSIQGAVLPSLEQMNELLDDHFVLFKPKDIVSGDFYWGTKSNQFVVVCVADCTGHGVPGAFMSMLGVSFLNDIIHKEQVTIANEILWHLRESIITALKQKGEGGEQKDGMDIGLCVFDTLTNEMQYAGGYNPCWLIPNTEYKEIRVISPKPDITESQDEMNIIQLKPNKMPIAIHNNMTSFTNNLVQLYPGDQVYLMSDGFEDQFGGQHGKKFMAKNLRQLVAANSNLPLGVQCEKLNQAFEAWKGAGEQTDDVTILGIKVGKQ